MYIYTKKAVRKKIPKRFGGIMDSFFLLFTFHVFFPIFFCITDIYLLSFSKILSENML